MRLVITGQSDPDKAGDPIGSAIFSGGMPLEESSYLAIGETPERIELFDGSLHAAPAASPRHQHISSDLAVALDHAAQRSGLHALQAVNVRLRADRIAIPDLIVARDIDFDELVVDASAVRLVCEIVSPVTAAIDRVLKMHYYAAAGIPWYLLVEQDSGTLHLFALSPDGYVEEATAEPGQALTLTEPVEATLHPQELLPGA